MEHAGIRDAMTYVRNYGNPDLFITFTCNPNMQEIKFVITRPTINTSL